MTRPFTTELLLRRTCGLIIAIALVAVLYLAREVFLPLTLAILLAFLLSSPVKWLERRKLPRVASVVLVIFLAGGGLLFVITILSSQVVSLANDLPKYKENIISKVQAVKKWTRDSTSNFINLYDEPETTPKTADGNDQESEDDESKSSNPSNTLSEELVGRSMNKEAVPVIVTNSDVNAWGIAKDWLGPILSPISLLGLVTLFTIFMLIERDDLRNRLVVLLGNQRLYGTTQMFDETATKVSSYLRTQFLLNSIYGCSIALVLGIVGLPNALLWGFTGFLLRFLPYLGPIISMALPIILSLAVFEGWKVPVMITAMYIVIELILNNILEPLMYGSSTGLSTMGILVSALFWTWLWGIPGLILATPMTVCISVLGRHFPQWRFMNILLGDEPALPPATVLYQRLLARDLPQVTDGLESFLAEHKSIERLCDEVLLPVMRMVEMDQHLGNMTIDEKEGINNDLQEMISVLFEDNKLLGVETENSTTPIRILCIPARDAGDELSCELISIVLRRKGYVVDLLPKETLAAEAANLFHADNYDLAIISALPPAASMHIRYLCKRLRVANPKSPILVGYWLQDQTTATMKKQMEERGADRFTNTLQESLAWIKHEAPHWHSIRTIQESNGKISEPAAQA